MTSQMPVDSRTNLASSNLSRNSSRSSWVEENLSFERTRPEQSITQAWQNSLCMSRPTYTMVSRLIVCHHIRYWRGGPSTYHPFPILCFSPTPRIGDAASKHPP